jgi:hypothetical protein
MYTSTYLIDDFVLIYEFATGEGILFDLGFVGPRSQMLVTEQ